MIKELIIINLPFKYFYMLVTEFSNQTIRVVSNGISYILHQRIKYRQERIGNKTHNTIK